MTLDKALELTRPLSETHTLNADTDLNQAVSLLFEAGLFIFKKRAGHFMDALALLPGESRG